MNIFRSIILKIGSISINHEPDDPDAAHIYRALKETIEDNQDYWVEPHEARERELIALERAGADVAKAKGLPLPERSDILRAESQARMGTIASYPSRMALALCWQIERKAAEQDCALVEPLPNAPSDPSASRAES